MPETYTTIIIGGGIAGLSCARKLKELGEEFLLITPELGGRIRASEDGKINYGALWAGSNYRHMNKFIKKGRKVNKRDACMYIDGPYCIG